MTDSEWRVFNSLTPKERTVILEVIKGGRTNKEIARELGNTEQVIKNYLRKIFDKTGMGSRTELAMFCRDHPELLDAIGGGAIGGNVTAMKHKKRLGRIVFYVPTREEAIEFNDRTSPIPAVIVAVFNDGSVNLKVLTNGPRDFWRREVFEQTLPEQRSCWKW